MHFYDMCGHDSYDKKEHFNYNFKCFIKRLMFMFRVLFHAFISTIE